MLKKNCHQVLGSQKSKLTPPELVFQTAGAINPPPTKIGLNCNLCWMGGRLFTHEVVLPPNIF